MKRLKKWQLAFLLFLICGTAWVLSNRSHWFPHENQGKVFGTYYHIKYEYDRDLENEIHAELDKVDASLSMFNMSSTISRINRNEIQETDSLFREVFTLAKTVSHNTDGAFDITVAPLVNAWGFGFKNSEHITDAQIDSLLDFVGYDKVDLAGKLLVKKDARVMLDCGAIAKGYGVDCVARLFRRLGIRNYMVEIGGEVVAGGLNPEGKSWRIGVSKPVEDAVQGGEEVQTVLNISDKALATSGNYRNFYYKDGKRYAHTIHPKTGRPVCHSLLSASVLAADCATADAYATAFMVVGLDGAREILVRNPDLAAYLIYEDGRGKLCVWLSPEMKKYVQS